MEIIIQPTAEAASATAALMVARLLREKPDAVLGLATGSTPLLLYRELVQMKLDWSRVTTFNLDEYVGLTPRSPGQSFSGFMWENLFRHVNIVKSNVHIPDGQAEDVPGSVCELRTTDPRGRRDRFATARHRHRRAYRVQRAEFFLGLAHADQDADTADPRRQRAVFWRGKPPCRIMSSRWASARSWRRGRCVLLAFGANKARAVAAAVEGPITAMNPASILQLHPVTKIVLDETRRRATAQSRLLPLGLRQQTQVAENVRTA